MPRSRGAIRIRSSTGPSGSSTCARRCRKWVWGEFAVIRSPDLAVLILRYDWRNNSVLFVHNLDAKPREIRFAVGLSDKEQGKLLINLLSEDHSRAGTDGKHRLVIEGYG